ncbi:unnamed protein product [Calicophoron daubneyi]|uniref:Cadherin domain-containing protein n=1 Tax=Calicophoron daubneyi TaxID=300641 RepID=A0AAV2T5Z4_CALDB
MASPDLGLPRQCWLYILTVTVLLTTICQAAEEIQVHLQMREETTPFTRIGSVAASLPADLGSKLHFLTDSTFFSVTPTNGEVRVARLIDRERLCPEYKLCCGVVACQLDARIFVTNKVSGEFAASVNLKVDIQDQNDNRPTFSSSSQTVSILESAPVGTYLSLVPATDADIEPANQIQRYTLIEPTGTFALDPSQLPTVRLQLMKPLNREEVSSYSATLEACDPGACARQTLEIQIIDENDNSPIFDSTTFTKKLPENTEVGKVVLHLNATDADSGDRGKVIYAFHGVVDSDLIETFDLVHDTGEIRLKRPLAANIRDTYRFRVVACDAVNPSCSGDVNSTAEITFAVEDINNFPPTIHAVAAGVAATDMQHSESHQDRDSATTAGGMGNNFKDSLRIMENTPPSQVAVITVRDDDIGENARVTCALSDSDKKDQVNFILSPSAPGVYSLRTARVFDYEVEQSVNTKIVCHDYGKPKQLTSARILTVQIGDVNEFQPEFSRRVYVGRVPENAPAGMEILTTTATDRDRGAVLRYKFAPPPVQQHNWDESHGTATESEEKDVNNVGVNKYFVIEPQTGTVRTSHIPLDRETFGSLTLVVLVTDSEIPPVFTATTTVSIEVLDENDNAPVFINPPADVAGAVAGRDHGKKSVAFTVMENAPRFTRVSQQLEANDPDQGDNGRVHFSLLETYALTRPNNLSPYFSSDNGDSRLGSIDTELPANTLSDLSLSRRVVDQPIFRITPDGGIETLVELDRESVPAYILKIAVQDRGAQPLASTTLVRVDVLDANDNAPVWVFPTPTDRTINLTTAMKPGSLAGRLRAEDADADEAGRVVYMFLGPRGEQLKGVSMERGLISSLYSKDEQQKRATRESKTKSPPAVATNVDMNGYRLGPLYLNGSTGEIWIAQILTAGTINLHLRAQDQGVPKMYTDGWLTINVFVDPSDDPGFFSLGGDGTLNITIILTMITITAIVSLFLVIGIVCVRRRPVRYTSGHPTAMADGAPGNGVCEYPVNMNKEGMGAGMQTGAWGSPMGIYASGQFMSGQGPPTGSPVMDDGQMFTAIGNPGMMGYGAMIAPSETASLIYVPQPPPQSNMSSLGGGSMTPVQMDPTGSGVDMPPRSQLHTFGTLTRNRGSFSGGYYPGPAGCGGMAYEPHLDADSGDSGRGPSEEGNQFLLTDGYRNAVSISGNPVGHQYNTYAGYRPSSRAGYYRQGVPVDGGNPMLKMNTLGCTSPSGAGCACYALPEGGGMSEYAGQPLHGFQTIEDDQMECDQNYPGPRSSLDMPLPPPPAPPPRSPNARNVNGNFKSDQFVPTSMTQNAHQDTYGGAQQNNVYYRSGDQMTDTDGVCDRLAVDDMNRQESDMDCEPQGTVTPVRIDLRQQSNLGTNDQCEYLSKPFRNGNMVTNLPPLATKLSDGRSQNMNVPGNLAGQPETTSYSAQPRP